MRDKIRSRQYVMTLHAEEEMVDDNLTIFDVERTVLTGEIIERQSDQHSNEWKYLVFGAAFDEREVTVVSKISTTGKLIIITVYLGK
jgi:hypothetical protein